jgi:arylsulfatase A-like enzyme
MIYDGGPHVEVTPDDRAELFNTYDEEVRFFDRLFGELMARLAADALLDRTLVVLAADHGEELLEHEQLGHCRNLAYETVLATPMVWWVPGLAPAVRDGLVSNADLAPTVLDLLGLPPLPQAEGKSLRPLLEEGRAVNRLAFAMQGRTHAVTDGRWKLLRDAESGRRQLFDVAADPFERADLAAARPAEVERLGAALAGWVRRVTGGDEAGALEDAREAERQLRAVGYL